MEKEYIYKNAIVYITMHSKSTERIRNATETFLRKVMLEKETKNNGNRIKTRAFREKQILDR